MAFVGTGTPGQAAAFALAHAGPHPVLVDRERALFAAAGMRRSLVALLAPRLWRNAWRAWRAGHHQGALQGDAWQLGGVVVFAANGARVHQEVERVAGDLLDLPALVSAVRSASA